MEESKKPSARSSSAASSDAPAGSLPEAELPALLAQGISLQNTGRLEEAARIFERVVGQQPKQTEAWARLGAAR